jgi:hypothetical protein
MIFASPKIRLGLAVGIFLSGVLALLVPHGLIGGCAMRTMPCRMVAFPSITVIATLLLIGTALNAVYLTRAEKRTELPAARGNGGGAGSP